MLKRASPTRGLLLSMGLMTLTSVVLFLAGTRANRSLEFDYLLWNLFLAWLPLGFSLLLIRSLHGRLWSNWLPFSLTVIWVVLLPNSFYMISDFVHIQDVTRHNLLYDVVMLSSFIFTGVLIGLASLYIVHQTLLKRLSRQASSALIALVLLLSSFAIYLGRELRWNSWDVLFNPAGIIFDVSDHLMHPLSHGDMFTTTLSFFILLASMYGAGRLLVKAAR